MHAETKVLTYNVYGSSLVSEATFVPTLQFLQNRSVNQRKENDPKFEIDHFGLKVINYDNTSED